MKIPHMKKLYFLILSFCFFNGLNAQVVTFPDLYFRESLLKSATDFSVAKDVNGNYLKVDANENNQIEESELLPIVSLKINSSNVRDLTGILKFVNLTELDVNSCYLSSLNVSELKDLKTLRCANNSITSLNLTGLSKIEILECSNNLLTSLDLTLLTGLKNLSIAKNKLTVLNVKSFKDLESLSLESNYIQNLDISNLTKLVNATFYGNPLTILNASNCTSLKYISVMDQKLTSATISGCSSLEELAVANSQITNLNAENCIKLSKLSGTEVGGYARTLNLKNCKSLTDIKMTNFGAVEMDLSYCSALTSLVCGRISLEKLNLLDCSNLKTLTVSNNLLKELDLTNCINLEKVAVGNNSLTTLSFSGKKIQELSCNANLLTSLNLSGFSDLVSLQCSGNKLATINTTGVTGLKKLNCSNNLLTDIAIKQAVNLEEFDCTNNKLASLDVSNLSKLKIFEFGVGNSVLKSLNASGCVLLENLSISNPLELINLSDCTGLKYFYLTKVTYTPYGNVNLNLENCSNLLTCEVKSRIIDNINVTNCSKLNSFKVTSASIDKMVFNNNPVLSSVFFEYVTFLNVLDLRILPALTDLYLGTSTVSHVDVSNSPNLTTFTGLNTIPLESVNASGCKKLNAYTIRTKKLDLSGCIDIRGVYYDNNSRLETLDVTGCSKIEEIYVAYNGFHSLKYADCPKLAKLSLISTALTNLDISNYPNLKEVIVGRSNSLTEVTFSSLPLLKRIELFNNSVSSLDLKNIKSLEFLDCSENKLTNLDIQGLANLIELRCTKNKLTSLHTSDFRKLEKLDFSYNEIKNINVTNLNNLIQLDCSDNLLDELDVSGSPNINYLMCLRNKFTILDLNNLTKLSSFNCVQNEQLTSLFLSNLNKDVYISFYISSNPNLKYICVDESRVKTFQNEVYRLGYFNCHVNSYCSFTPNGTYAFMKGNTRLDANNNGCEISDLNVPNLKFQIKSSSTEGAVISDDSGFYTFPIQEGNFEIVPKLECADYFTISPSSLNVKIDSQTTPILQDFCLVPNGIRKDLEIVLIPLEEARPGFDAKYKVFYKNKGNVAQSGSIDLAFNDSVLDLIQSTPATSTQVNNKLTWNFNNLKPFESKEIVFTFNVNSPTEIPAINNGDTLSFTGTIKSDGVDELPLDNAFTLSQVVVGSYDPNDKTCLEGSVITPSLIGEYVHYMIRFENTGTYPAENIVVKDMIDLNKFDISTLMPTSSSHSFVTKISEGNKVEFIFENINLPFDDASNDGYIAFKIKTKPTLKVGDSFTNDANIYFDYNFPILTNKATSTFKTSTLSTQDFNFSRYLILYPNPSDQILNISQNENIAIQSFEIYDILGQLIIAIPNAKTTSNIDISKLKSGNYFIRVKSDKGSSSMKFIKI